MEKVFTSKRTNKNNISAPRLSPVPGQERWIAVAATLQRLRQSVELGRRRDGPQSVAVGPAFPRDARKRSCSRQNTNCDPQVRAKCAYNASEAAQNARNAKKK